MSVDLWTHQTIAGNGDAAQPVAFEDSEDAFLYKNFVVTPKAQCTTV